MTYEYLCSDCGHEWEAEQSINDKPLKKCPKCHKLRARRQVSGGTGFLLKGGGWYADGYGSSPASKTATKDSSKDSSGDTATTEKKAETNKNSKEGTAKPEKSGKTAA